VKRALLVAALACSLGMAVPAQAAPAAPSHSWFEPAHEGRSYVNQHLTLDRLLKGHPKASWRNQLVLWEGDVLEQKVQGTETRVKLRCGSTVVNVHCPLPVYTLDVDRTGYRVAVKGEVEFKDGRFAGLIGRSFILLSPKRPWSRSTGLQRSLDKLKAPQMAGFLAWWVQCHHPDYKQEQCAKVGVALVREAQKNSIDPLFFASLVQIESAFRVDAVSETGAYGLGQLMPGTASDPAFRRIDVDVNTGKVRGLF